MIELCRGVLYEKACDPLNFNASPKKTLKEYRQIIESV